MYSVFRPTLVSTLICGKNTTPDPSEVPLHTRFGPRYMNEQAAKRVALRHLGQVRDSATNRVLADYLGWAKS